MACSSPRRWGTPGRRAAGHVVDRFIPTPVGNAGSARCAPGCAAVHPHARGERSPRPAWCWPGVGSSPRPWGTPGTRDNHPCAERFIPTPVGNASWRSSSLMRSFGSSPRPWGTLGEALRGPPSGRFIPTPVGNASSAPAAPPIRPVHPHARGERLKAAAAKGHVGGSSPRPWGTRHQDSSPHLNQRFIPTPVGNAP